MKKIISLIFTVFTVAILFAAARPSLDGRAVVADEGEMPKGLFARTIGYLPGDSVTVTNPANGSTVDVLILGAIDSGEGVAILLSPEAADRLLIKKDSNVQVKITKRTGSLDENVSGTAVLSDETPEPDYTNLEKPVEPAPEAVTPKIPETEIAPDAEKSIVVESAAVVADSEPLVPSPAFFPANLDEEKETEKTPVVADEIDETVIPEYENDPADVIEDPSKKVEDAVVEIEEVESEAFSEEVPEIVEDGELVEEKAPEVKETEVPAESVEKEEIPEIIESEKVDEEISAEVADTSFEAVPAEDVVNESAGEAESNDEYAPIILVPSEPNPPEEAVEVENTEEVAESADNSAVTVESAVTEEAVEVEPSLNVIAEENKVEAENKTENETTPETIDYESFVKGSLKELESGKYYLQIASLSDKDNIEKLLAKYAPKYPVVLVPFSGSKTMQVMIGPLTADEYGMIKERFLSYGFKDCFLRKIK